MVYDQQKVATCTAASEWCVGTLVPGRYPHVAQAVIMRSENPPTADTKQRVKLCIRYII